MTASAPPLGGRSVRIAGRDYAVVLPRLRDPRLHVAAVIVSVQVLGQAVLGFDVSIAQILLCIGTAGLLELTIVAVTEQKLAWPASALLTGNGVALILRSPTTVHGDWWSLDAWPMFVAAAGVSLLSKYAIRVGDRHVFNPSNLGLVVVFLLFGSQRADPQDLWWGPLRAGLVITFVVILVGGFTLSARLKLFSVAVTFWATFAAGIALLAWRGHAITARWHAGPVTDWDYWLIFVLSPEIVIFVFFMITDPRTAPVGRVARPVYAFATAVVACVLAAFQRTEFATKVSLLAALVIVCALRPLLERWFSDERLADPAGGRIWRQQGGRLRPTIPGIAGIAAVAMVSSIVIMVAGSGTTTIELPPEVRAASRGAAVRPAVPKAQLEAWGLPTITVDHELSDIDGAVREGDADQIARDLVEDVILEGETTRVPGDPSIAASAAFGIELERTQQLATARERAGDSVEPGTIHRLELAILVLLKDPGNPQATPQLGVLARGQDHEAEPNDRDRLVPGRPGKTVDRVYLVTKVGDHYLIGETLPADTDMVVGDAALPAD